MNKLVNVLCVGGGHCNVQVLKLLKKVLPSNAKVTLVSEYAKSYYSGMLPGTVASMFPSL